VSTVLPRRFALVRQVDYTGVSGVGVVAFGIAFADGHVALRWCSTHPATSTWSSLDDMLAVHGPGQGASIQWIDAPSTELEDMTVAPGTGRRARRRAARSDDEPVASTALGIPDPPPNGFQRPLDGVEAADASVPAPRQPGRHRRASQLEQPV
jgi:prepilin-type processing-associated H-X9-DG protein